MICLVGADLVSDHGDPDQKRLHAVLGEGICQALMGDLLRAFCSGPRDNLDDFFVGEQPVEIIIELHMKHPPIILRGIFAIVGHIFRARRGHFRSPVLISHAAGGWPVAGHVPRGWSGEPDREPVPSGSDRASTREGCAAVQVWAGNRLSKCSFYVLSMGARNSSRVRRLSAPLRVIPGQVRLAVCKGCGHRDALPVDRMIAKFGADFPVEESVWWLKCSQCGIEHRAEASVARLCEPGCARQLG